MKIGYVLWEAVNLIALILAALGYVMLRRRLSGRRAFTDRDRQLLFADPPNAAPRAVFALKFGATVLLCIFLGFLELYLFGGLGGAIVTAILLLTFITIVRNVLLN